jgi:hypothetical protein
MLTPLICGVSVGFVIGTREMTEKALREGEVEEEVGSHQRLVAVLVESHDLLVDPDPILTQADIDKLAELESILYKI